ncbi:MAG TPA: PAS domain S-box protein [Candidatus Limnocylindrales bacterium]|nr:PAS domain S-box protein [Candidatus Limnocylindrales bacterium]
MQAEPATIVLDAAGRFLDASPAALELFGMSRDELLAADSSTFSPEPRDPDSNAALRDAWEAEGRPDLGGEATILRRDGDRRRVRFIIATQPDDRFVAVLEPVNERERDRPIVYTAGQTLAEWRAAERRLEAIPPESAEWRAAQAQIEALRSQYHRLFDARR